MVSGLLCSEGLGSFRLRRSWLKVVLLLDSFLCLWNVSGHLLSCGPSGKDHSNSQCTWWWEETLGVSLRPGQWKCWFPALLEDGRSLGLIWASVLVSRQCCLYFPKQEFQVGKLAHSRPVYSEHQLCSHVST